MGRLPMKLTALERRLRWRSTPLRLPELTRCRALSERERFATRLPERWGRRAKALPAVRGARRSRTCLL